ncbi:MAG: glucuronate isomerase [Clostridia bacterium]|nr:glucuronate isomerase [Clostridia bacterium]
MGIINDTFMLKGDCARRLYDEVRELPIIDYHCHLSPKQIAEDYKFKNATDLFLGGDHYKWRQMRTAGIDERYITGDGDDREKFARFAEMMPYLIGNPIYHWTHLELKRYFDIDEPLSPESCERIWNRCNELLATDEYSARNLILRSRVEALCTTDDPADTLEYHEALADFECRVLPTFRPDKLVEIGKDTFLPYIESVGITTYEGLCAWVKERIEYFASHGCRLSDHSLEKVPYAEGDAAAVFARRVSGEAISEGEADIFRTEIMKLLAKEYAAHGWCMQLHIGALRNNNKRMFERLGADVGFDSMNDFLIAEPLSALLNSFAYEGNLPKTILYTLNPIHNYVLGTMIGNFQDGSIAGKVQFGSGWWFNDQRDGMEAQMRALANLGMLSKFVGMLTDSRSFVSYTRHEYFRRILCSLIGKWVDEGEYPADMETLTKIVKDICYYNAKRYFGF